MNLKSIQKRCEYYYKRNMLTQEIKLLKKIFHYDPALQWDWGLERMKMLSLEGKAIVSNQNAVQEVQQRVPQDMAQDSISKAHVEQDAVQDSAQDPAQVEHVVMDSKIKSDVHSNTKLHIAQLSFQYQREWRFEKEKRFIEHAMTLFPDWDYLKKRLEWHKRPIFHREPALSKTQPRIPLVTSRNPEFIPHENTLQAMCFVTATGSNQPYFDLTVQLIESIQNMQHYCKAAIKILDCGLTAQDKDYLIKRFHVEIKEPVVPKLPNVHVSGWIVGLLARAYLDRCFPGYEYYFWVDADTWFQDDLGIDKLLFLAQEHQIGVMTDQTIGIVLTQTTAVFERHDFKNRLHKSLHSEDVLKTPIIFGGVWCMSVSAMKQFALCTQENAAKMQGYMYGSDMAIMQYMVRTFYPKAPVIEDFTIPGIRNSILNNKGYFENASIVNLNCNIKKLGYYCFIDQSMKLDKALEAYRYSMKRSRHVTTLEVENEVHKIALQKQWDKGSYFFRTFPMPEQLYGSIEQIL